MKNRWLSSLALAFTPALFALSLGACAAEAPPPQVPEPAPVAPPVEPVAAVEPPVAPPPVEAPPPPKPGKEKIVGQWIFAFEGEPKAKVEAEAQKKFPKEKDSAKREAYVKKVADDAAGEWIEFVDGAYVSHTTAKGKDKVVLKVKYDVSKDESAALVMKPAGKDEVSKKALKDDFAVTFVDDNTIQIKDPKKNMVLVFKRK